MQQSVTAFFQSLSWQYLAILATFVYGVMNFLYKVAAEYKCSSFHIMSFSGLSVSILSFIVIFFTKSPFSSLHLILLFACVNAFFFAAGSICKIEALRNIPANISFPVIKLNVVLTIIIAVLFFSERPNFNQIVGICSGIGVILILAAEKWKVPGQSISFRKGLLFSVSAAFCSAISMTVGKVVSTTVPKLNYIFISYTLVAIYSYLASTQKKAAVKGSSSLNYKTVGFGVVIGSMNFLGYFLVLSAFSKGPMSSIQPIFAMSVVIPIIMSRIFYGEKLNLHRVIALFLSIISIILISKK